MTISNADFSLCFYLFAALKQGVIRTSYSDLLISPSPGYTEDNQQHHLFTVTFKKNNNNNSNNNTSTFVEDEDATEENIKPCPLPSGTDQFYTLRFS